MIIGEERTDRVFIGVTLFILGGALVWIFHTLGESIFMSLPIGLLVLIFLRLVVDAKVAKVEITDTDLFVFDEYLFSSKKYEYSFSAIEMMLISTRGDVKCFENFLKENKPSGRFTVGMEAKDYGNFLKTIAEKGVLIRRKIQTNS